MKISELIIYRTCNLQHEAYQPQQLRSSDNSDLQHELNYDSMPRNFHDMDRIFF